MSLWNNQDHLLCDNNASCVKTNGWHLWCIRPYILILLYKSGTGTVLTHRVCKHFHSLKNFCMPLRVLASYCFIFCLILVFWDIVWCVSKAGLEFNKYPRMAWDSGQFPQHSLLSIGVRVTSRHSSLCIILKGLTVSTCLINQNLKIFILGTSLSSSLSPIIWSMADNDVHTQEALNTLMTFLSSHSRKWNGWIRVGLGIYN